MTQAGRADAEKLQLRLAVGAAESRLYVSFPTVEVGEGRPRVPSLYALEIWRAMTGRVPSADELQQAAARASQATLAWPAPADRDEAIDRARTRSVHAARSGGRTGSPGARPRAVHAAVERLPAAIRARALHARQEDLVALGRHHDGDRPAQAGPGHLPSRGTHVLVVGAAEIRRVPLSVLSERHLPDAARRGSRAAAAHGSADARQPVPRHADRVLPAPEAPRLPADRGDGSRAGVDGIGRSARRHRCPRVRAAGARRSIASGRTRSRPSGGTCGCGWTRSPASGWTPTWFEWASA